MAGVLKGNERCVMRTVRGLPLVVLITLVLPAHALGQGGSADPDSIPPYTLESSHETLGPFYVTGGTVQVDLRMERLRPDSCFSYDETTLVVGFKDDDGGWLFRRPLPNRITPEGYDHCFRVAVQPLNLVEECVLQVAYQVVPAEPMTGLAMRLFGWHDDDFGPLGPGITGCGTFESLPGREVDEPLELVDGVLPFDACTGCLKVRVPLSVDLDELGSTPTGPWGLPGEGDTYIGELAVTGSCPLEVGDSARQVTLYDAPQGSAGLPATIRTDSEVELGPAYGRVQLALDRRGMLVTVEVEVQRLHVRIDDREGWVTDYEALGLAETN